MEVVGQTFSIYMVNFVWYMYIVLFYNHNNILGSIGVIWFAIWLFVAFDSPAKHPRISVKEQNYIESSIDDRKTIFIVSPPNNIHAYIYAHVCTCIILYKNAIVFSTLEASANIWSCLGYFHCIILWYIWLYFNTDSPTNIL